MVRAGIVFHGGINYRANVNELYLRTALHWHLQMTNYSFNIRNVRSGNLLFALPEEAFISFYYRRLVNEPGEFEGTINSSLYPQIRNIIDLRGSRYPQGITLDAILEVWRQPTYFTGLLGLWRLDAQFLIRYVRDEMLDNGIIRFTVIGRDIKHLLGRAAIFPKGATPPEGQSSNDFSSVFPWTLPTEDTFKGSPHVNDDDSTAEKMYGMFLRAQAVNQIALDPTYVTNATIEPGGIPNHVIGERYSNLLEALQNASGASWFASYYAFESTPADEGCDFDLLPAPTPPYWPWTFKVFIGGRGTKRTKDTLQPVVFSFTEGVSTPTYIHDMLTQKTRAIVGGFGEGVDRDVILVTNPTAIGYSPLNKADAYLDARQAEELDETTPEIGFGQLVKEGLYLLKEEGEQEEFTFHVGSDMVYGLDFDLGDVVSVETPYLSRDYQIRGVHVRMGEDGREEVSVEFGLLDGTSVRGRDLLEQMLQLIKENEKKMEEAQAAE